MLMKKYLFLIAMSAALLTGCKKDNLGNQDQPTDVPSIETGTASLSIPAQGGTIELTYEIINPAEDGQISAEQAENWIHDFNCDTDGKISFTADANESTDSRSQELTLTYTYGDGNSVQAKIDAVQDAAAPVQYDFDLTLNILEGEYYGDMYGNNGEYNWYTYISDIGFDANGYTQPNGTYYVLDIFGPAPEDESNLLPPAGEYILGEEGATEEMTFTPDYSEVAMTDAEGALEYSGIFTEGRLTISYEGENMVLEAFLTDSQGKTHHVKYNGPADYFDNSDGDGDTGEIPQSTLTEDYTLDLSGATGRATYYGDYYGTGGGNWVIDIMQESGDSFMTDLVAEGTDFESGITSGTYTASSSYSPLPGEYLQGYVDYGIGGTAYANVLDGMAMEYAIAVSGDLKITNNGDGTYVISFEFLDPQGYTWDGEWSGNLEVVDSETYQASISKAGAPVSTGRHSFDLPVAGKKDLAAAAKRVRTRN